MSPSLTTSEGREGKVIYLDQQHWVALLKGGTGAAVEVLSRLKSDVEEGKVVVPLSCAHYLETWHRARWKSRSELAAVMRDLSRWSTLAPTQEVARLEIEGALGGGTAVTANDILGVGVNHAFASPTGRLRLVEWAWTPEWPEEGPSIAGVTADFQEVQDRAPEAWEWFNLAGLDGVDFPIPEFDDSQFEIRPEHRRGDEFIADERDLVARLAANGNSHRLREALVMRDIHELLDDINLACRAVGYSPDNLRVEGALTALHRRLHSRDLLVDLRWLRLQDPGLPLEQHDRTDLMGLCVALVYCDVVVTERRWKHFARRAKVSDRFGTAVFSSVADLLPLL